MRQPQGDKESSAVNVRVRQRVHKNSNAGVAVTFQEVVESFTNQHDIHFYLKSGFNSKRDGKCMLSSYAFLHVRLLIHRIICLILETFVIYHFFVVTSICLLDTYSKYVEGIQRLIHR